MKEWYSMFRIEIIDNNECLIACQTFNNYGDMIQAYKLIRDKYYDKFKNCKMQVFTGLNFWNLRENKNLEVSL